MALALFIGESTMAQEDSVFSAVWWNVENLFDTRDDPHTNDDEFTPQGDMHWTRRKLQAKLQGIAKTLAMADLPDVVGLAEVENSYVLRELCQGTPLARAGYRYVHRNSPDRRGIDCALLYRTDRFRVLKDSVVRVSDSAEGFFTRDILVVEGVTAQGDTVSLVRGRHRHGRHEQHRRRGPDGRGHGVRRRQHQRRRHTQPHLAPAARMGVAQIPGAVGLHRPGALAGRRRLDGGRPEAAALRPPAHRREEQGRHAPATHQPRASLRGRT